MQLTVFVDVNLRRKFKSMSSDLEFGANFDDLTISNN